MFYGIDVMYIYDSNVLLMMCYVDCVLVYFYSIKYYFIVLVYVGWCGIYIEIVKEVLKYVNFDLKDLYVVIGLFILLSYEINDDIKNKFEILLIDSVNYIEIRGWDCYGIDLKKVNVVLLIYYGVFKENIYMIVYVIFEYLELFFFYWLEKG